MSSSDYGRIGRSLRRTPTAIGSVTRRREGIVVLLASTVGYLLLYLWAIGDLSLRSTGETSLFLVEHPFTRMFEGAPGAFSYEPIASVEVGVGIYLFSPINTAIGLVIAGLVGINMALAYLAITQPTACGIRSGSGLLAAIPALLAGSACCAPVVLIVLGITASSTLLAVLPWLLPAGLLFLVGSVIYLAGQIDPTVLAD